ncbi:MAG: O-antigen ligase family protein, partial [Sciscionella sp.]
VYLTGSRGTLLVLAAVLVLWCLLAGRRYRRLLLFTPLAVALLLVLPGVGTRLASITDVSTTSAETADLSLTGRIGVQELGAHMFAEHPAIGVGVANFQTVEPDYQQRYGIEGPILAPHNLYLEMAAESGLLGLAGWLGLYGSGLFVAGRARLLSRPRSPTENPSAGWLLMTGAMVGLLGWGLASILLHLNNFRVLTLLLAIAAGVDLRARRALAGNDGTIRLWTDLIYRHVPPRVSRPPRTRGFAVAVVAFLVLTSASLFVPGVFVTQWSASTGLRVTAVSERRPVDAYVVDVSTREGLLLTYLSLLGNERFQTAAADALRLSPEQRSAVTVTATTGNPPGLLQVTATGKDRAVVRGMARGVAERTTGYLASLKPFYTLRPVPGVGEPSSTTTVRPLALGLVLLVDAAVAAAGWLLLNSRWRLSIRIVRPQRTPSRS